MFLYELFERRQDRTGIPEGPISARTRPAGSFRIPRRATRPASSGRRWRGPERGRRGRHAVATHGRARRVAPRPPGRIVAAAQEWASSSRAKSDERARSRCQGRSRAQRGRSRAESLDNGEHTRTLPARRCCRLGCSPVRRHRDVRRVCTDRVSAAAPSTWTRGTSLSRRRCSGSRR